MRKVCSLALALMLPAVAAAQTPATTPAQPAPATAPSPSSESKGFVAIHVGGQAGSSALSDTFTFSVYDEIGTVTTNQDYGGGFLFNIEGGVKFHPNLAGGLAITRAGDSSETRVSASIPHPDIFDRPRTVTGTIGDTNHSEVGFHFFVSYLFAPRPNLDVRIFAGPSIIQVKHDLVTAITFDDPSPFTNPTISGASLNEHSETVGAFHIGAGTTYHLTDRLGIDGFVRFARRTVDIDGVSGGNVELKVGGAQFGIGVRLGF